MNAASKNFRVILSAKYFYRTFELGCLIFLGSACALAEVKQEIVFREFAVQKLESQKLSKEFIEVVLKAYDESRRDQIIEKNVLGFRSSPNYGEHSSEKAFKKCIKFIKTHQKALHAVEVRYNIPPALIAALLWVETKHGKRIGNYSVASVYFSLLQSDHPEMIKKLEESVRGDSFFAVSENFSKIASRSVKKAQWALDELEALSKISNKINLLSLKGSYAGAFGFPQFIPSSYLAWSASSQEGQPADLFNMDDAIWSVGSYLYKNLWKKGDPNSQSGALKHYNQSDDYVKVIREIQAEVEKRQSLLAKRLVQRPNPKPKPIESYTPQASP